MCYQNHHDCKYCGKPYPCEWDNYACPTINHDVNMYMCPACEDKLEEILEDKDLEQIDMLNVDLDELMRDDNDN